MAKNVVVKLRKINDVKSNLKYLADKIEHPETCFTYSTCSKDEWLEYRDINRQEFRRSNQKGKCIEAREMILVFPNEFYQASKSEQSNYCEYFVDQLMRELGVNIFGALHGSDKDNNNLHMHLMFMERKRVKQKESTATRKTWVDAEGKKIRTKKEAYENGKLRKGVTEYQKGEIVKTGNGWSAKSEYLRSKQFTIDVKERWADELNRLAWSFDLDVEKRQVHQHLEHHLRMQKLRSPKKYKDKEKMESSKRHCDSFNRPIITCNKFRKDYNKFLDSAIEKGILTNEEATERTKGVNEQIRELCLKGKKEKRKIKEVLENEVRALKVLIAQNRQNELLKNDIGEALKEFEEVTNFGRKSVLERISEAKKISEEDKKKRDVKIKESDFERF